MARGEVHVPRGAAGQEPGCIPFGNCRFGWLRPHFIGGQIARPAKSGRVFLRLGQQGSGNLLEPDRQTLRVWGRGVEQYGRQSVDARCRSETCLGLLGHRGYDGAVFRVRAAGIDIGSVSGGGAEEGYQRLPQGFRPGLGVD